MGFLPASLVVPSTVVKLLASLVAHSVVKEPYLVVRSKAFTGHIEGFVVHPSLAATCLVVRVMHSIAVATTFLVAAFDWATVVGT